MKCSICGASPATGASIYRNGSKGETCEWRCLAHLDQCYWEQVVLKVVAQIEAVQQKVN